MGVAELAAQDRGAQLQALLEARRHAIESGDLRRQIEAWNEVGGSMLFGRTPVTEVLAFLDEELAWGREHGLPAIEADALLGGPYLDSRLGRFDEARTSSSARRRFAASSESPTASPRPICAGSEMEHLAGDLAAAEREIREAIRVATRDGCVALSSRSTASTWRACSSTRVERSRRPPSSSRLASSAATRRSGRATTRELLPVEGRIDEALDEAREAAAAMAGSDNITAHAEVLVHLAEVLRASGDPDGASEALAARDQPARGERERRQRGAVPAAARERAGYGRVGANGASLSVPGCTIP